MKKKKNKIKKDSLQGFNLDYEYYNSFEYETDTYYACQNGSDCCQDDFCRCGKITGTVTEVPFQRLVELICDHFNFTEKIDVYGVDRILRIHKAYDPSYYELDIGEGYYGEEVEGITIDSKLFNKLNDSFTSFVIREGVDEKIRFLLNLEYGHILDSLENLKASVQKITKTQIFTGNETYYKKVDRSVYSDYNGVMGVVKKEGDRYRLIDGYHRFHSITDTLEKFNYIVFE